MGNRIDVFVNFFWIQTFYSAVHDQVEFAFCITFCTLLSLSVLCSLRIFFSIGKFQSHYYLHPQFTIER